MQAADVSPQLFDGDGDSDDDADSLGFPGVTHFSA